ncbi:hypothetical protein F0562_003858 [Nyssa sinensis]|uniref:Chorein N-terminal domain-containing protein n=1 Tax=Nyssa sinensis TaxID=561372 RepID=A0A5J5BWP2_9ASTE|nr:hypothetical protein F0562_003858 [Nyssa sinensis]
MFLNDLVQRRLASLLHPWLQQEPELQFKLGFLRSHGFANNLSFDTSVLNQLLDEPTRLSFKEVRVDQLSLRISYWSVPAFTIAVHGVHVTLSVGQVKEEKRRNSTDTSLVDMRKVLTEIDPEGSALHDVMGRISDTGSSGNWTTPLLNVILNCCQLQMSDIHLQVEFPISNDSFGCLWEIKELNAESQYTKHGCFFRGLISSLFVPLKECSFNINVRGFGIGLQSKDSISRVLPSVDLFTCIKLKDLQLIDFTFSIPELTFLFTPADLSIILAFGTLSSSESKCARNGRQLWKIAASRISSLISTPRLVLHKLVDDVGLWLRYVHAYENLLLQFGYPVDNSLKISAAMMSWDIKVSRSVKNQWKLISEIEKKLPAEAIAQARRIARYRAGLNAQRAKDHSNESQKILPLLALAWNIICIIFSSITHFFSQIFLADNPKIDGHCRVVSEDSFSQHCFSLSVDKISIIASPVNAVQPPVWGKVVSEIGISYSELLSFCLSIDALFLTYTENICEQYFSISCGHLKVMSSSIIEDGSKNNNNNNNNNNNTSYLKRHWDKNFDDAKTIVWGEPAQMFYPVDTRNGFPYDLERTSVSFLENLLGETWLNWKNSCTNFEGIKIQNLENPWILCEIKSFLTDQGLQNLNSGFWKCSLIVGKLNFVLGYSSLLLIALLLGQIQHALYMGYSNGRKKVLSLAPVTLDRGMEMTMARMLPEKHIQIGVFIAGPHIQISLRKEGFYGGNSNVNPIVRQDDLHLAFDVHNIEFAVWPILKSAFASSSGYRGLDDVHQLECLRKSTLPNYCTKSNNYPAIILEGGSSFI